MNKKLIVIYGVVVLTVILAAIINAFVFNSSFAHDTIDYFSFIAAFFLIADGFYKLWRYKNESYFPQQFLRHIRIIIGTCVFTIHVMQYVYGV